MRVLLFRVDKLGDLIVSSPVIAAIKAKHPNAEIMLVASPYNAPAARGLPNVDNLVLWDGAMNRVQKYAAFQTIRKFKATHTLVMSPKNDCYILSLLSGAATQGWILMEYRYPPRFLSKFLLPPENRELIPRKNRVLHHSEHILRLARRLGLADEGDFPYAIPTNEKDAANAREILREKNIQHLFIAVHLVDKWLEDHWRAEDIKNFLEKLHATLKCDVLCTAGPADKILSTEIEKDFPLLRNLSFAQWVAVLNEAALVITPDCAAVHIACALQKPLIALYPASRYTKAVNEYGPRGTACFATALQAKELQIPHLVEEAQKLIKNLS
jgi:ADP-heptose:LPS heptosyltransferase